MEYYFSVVKGVLPEGTHDGVLPVRRQYIAKGSRPHICTTTISGATGLLGGQAERLRGDGTSARAKPATIPSETSEGDKAARAAEETGCGIGSLTTVDHETGTRCVQYRPVTAPGSSSASGAVQCTVSSPVPSGRRLVCLIPVHDGPATHTHDTLYASDDRGSVYRLYAPADSAATVAARSKRVRHEMHSSSVHADAHQEDCGVDAWRLLTPARSTLPSSIVASAEAASVSLFSRALGAPGWAGLVPLDAGVLVSAREHYQDLRVIDVERSEVVRCFATTHPATGLIRPGCETWSLPMDAGATATTATELSHHVVLVAEGSLATLFDVRCPSAVLSLSATRTVQTSAADGANGASGDDPATTTAGDANTGPLVPGRLTSVNGQVRDVCSTAHPYEVAAAVDRALSVYDYRKFTRAFSSANVLKYSIASIAPFAGGRAVVCSGIDAEVRIIPLHPKETLYTTPETPLSLMANQSAASRPSAKTARKNDAGAPAPEDPTGSTFRTRLNSSVSCSTTWQGGWVSAVDGRIAVGISMDNELFVVQ